MKDYLYFDLLHNNERNSLYWASELFGVGLQKEILNILIKFVVFEVGILYHNLYNKVYELIANFFNDNHRKRKQIIITLIKLICNLKRNRLINNVYYLSYRNIIKYDIENNYNLSDIFKMNELVIIKFIRILIIKNQKYKIWNFLIKQDIKLENLYHLDNIFKCDYLIFLAFIIFSRKYSLLDLPIISTIKDSKIKYFGFNLKRIKDSFNKKSLSLDSKRGKQDILLKNSFLGYSLYDTFKNENLLNNFSENDIINNYGYIEFPYNYIKVKYNLVLNNNIDLDIDYKKEVIEFLELLEKKYNYYFLTYDNLNELYNFKDLDIIYDKYNLPKLED